MNYFLLQCILFPRNIILNRATRHISYENWHLALFFNESCCFLVIWNVLWMVFQLKKMERWPSNSKLLLGFKYAKSKHTGLFLNNSWTLDILWIPLKWYFGIIFCILRFFIIIYIEKFFRTRENFCLKKLSCARLIISCARHNFYKNLYKLWR